MGRFVYETHREAYLSARAGLRKRLGAIVGQDPSSLRFEYGDQGKPALADGPCFNLSHAGGFACLAVHPDLEVGLDIEAHRDVEDEIADRFFSASEVAALSHLSGQDRQAGFFRCWTRKEAVIKALGGGLSIPLDAFDVSLDERAATLDRLDPAYGTAADWALAPFSLGPTLVGCVAARSGTPIAISATDAPSHMTVAV